VDVGRIANPIFEVVVFDEDEEEEDEEEEGEDDDLALLNNCSISAIDNWYTFASVEISLFLSFAERVETEDVDDEDEDDDDEKDANEALPLVSSSPNTSSPFFIANDEVIFIDGNI
jgi:hypothetical protein